MNDQFVSYELALQLKELGYNEISLFCYDTVNEGNPLSHCPHLLLNNQLEGFENEPISAPLWQQAFDWCLNILKQSHALHACFYDGDNDCMIMEDFYLDSPKVLIDSTKEECLKKLIEIIEQ